MTSSALAGIDWNDLRRKAWHAALMLGSAYAASAQKYAWAVPVLTGMAGVSAPPAGLSRVGAMAALVVAAIAGALYTLAPWRI